VHRTFTPGRLDAVKNWRDLLAARRFAAVEACTERENAAGIPRAAYFFLGCGAYPNGIVGFVLDAPALPTRREIGARSRSRCRSTTTFRSSRAPRCYTRSWSPARR
jgi:hypothetical protein